METTEILTSLVRIILEAVIITGLLGYVFLKRDERLKRTIEEEFKKRDAFFSAQFDYKRRAVEELLGPVVMQLKRSSLTLSSYEPNDKYREGILKQCNETIRDLLLEKGYLLPHDLQPEAGDFLKHYDGWLQHHHLLREVKGNTEEPFVYTYDFPKEAEKKFMNKYEAFRAELKIDERLEK